MHIDKSIVIFRSKILHVTQAYTKIVELFFLLFSDSPLFSKSSCHHLHVLSPGCKCTPIFMSSPDNIGPLPLTSPGIVSHDNTQATLPWHFLITIIPATMSDKNMH